MNSWHKNIAQWQVGGVLYISVPFTWLLTEAYQIRDRWKGRALIGGPALMQPNECDGFEPILFHNPLATFTTRGCPNRCGFCAVPKLEGDFREIQNFRPAPIICDNNILASSDKHLRNVIEAVKHYPEVDFNQGLDARLFTEYTADLLQDLNCKMRFAFDSWASEPSVKRAVDICHNRGKKDITIYCLVGYKDTPDEAKDKLETIRSWGCLPFPMRYQPLDAIEKNSFVGDEWTERELSDLCRYYSRLAWFGGFSFDEYKETAQLKLQI